nr:MAG TPA: hypothetical protein [Caudoviricetes sp.]
MAIIPNLETTRKLTSQDIYDIIHFSAQSAEDNGFVNQYVFERALYAYAAIILYPDRKEEIGRMVSNNILDAWDALVSDGTTSDMEKNFSSDIKILGEVGSVWLDDYIKYLQSARGIFSTFQTFSGDIVESTVNRFKDAFNESDAKTVLEIADKWGMNNTPKDESKLKEKVKVKAMATPEQVNDAIKAATDYLAAVPTENEEKKEDSEQEEGPLFEL